MKVLVCGDREWTDRKTVFFRLSKLPEGSTILNGDCRGADRIAAEVARELGCFTVLDFPADWEKHGKAAGPIRNRQMLDQKPDLVIAFHEDLSRSKGTIDTVREAKRRKIPVEIISEPKGDRYCEL